MRDSEGCKPWFMLAALIVYIRFIRIPNWIQTISVSEIRIDLVWILRITGSDDVASIDHADLHLWLYILLLFVQCFSIHNRLIL